jgi:anti-anti-sigma regulatory factor
VLKIERLADDGAPVVLKVHGRVVGPWVDVLRRMCETAAAGGAPVVLDLEGVSFVDRDGAALLKMLATGSVTLRHCSAFVVEQLRTVRS